MPPDTPVSLLRGCAYARESEDRAGDAHNVADQLTAAHGYATAHPVILGRDYTDNDIGAYKGKPRKDYAAMMAAVARGEIQVIIVYHLSRLWRNRRERAEGIELLKKHGVSVWAVKGPQLDMSTAYGRGIAEMLGAVDSMEVEIKAERTALAEEGRAKNGQRNLSGPCGFGWQSSYEDRPGGRKRIFTLNEQEAEAIRNAAWTIMAGGSLMGIVRDWAARGVKPPQAVRKNGNKTRGIWTPQSVRYILANPAIASLRIYQGEEYPGDWPEIISPETWHAVTSILRDPGRRSPRGAVSLLGGIALCGACGEKMRRGKRKEGDPIYRCFGYQAPDKGNRHVSRLAGPVDEYVTDVVIRALADPDTINLLKPKNESLDMTRLREDRLVLSARRDEVNSDYSTGLLSRGEWLKMRDTITARIDDLDQRIAEGSRVSVAASLIGIPDVHKAWDELDIVRKRAVINALMTVTLTHGNRLAPVNRIVQVGPAR